MLPPEGINAAADLFALILESEIKGDSDIPYTIVLLSLFGLRIILLFPLKIIFFYGAAASASAFSDENEAIIQASVVGTIKLPRLLY